MSHFATADLITETLRRACSKKYSIMYAEKGTRSRSWYVVEAEKTGVSGCSGEDGPVGMQADVVR